MKQNGLALCSLLCAALLFGGCSTSADSPATTAEETSASTTSASEAVSAAASEWFDEEEEETYAPLVLEEDRAQIWDPGNQVFAWIPVPEGYYIREEFSHRGALVLGPVDPDTLNADADYFVYNAEEGYLDENMDDALEEEADILRSDPDLLCEGPSPAEAFTVNGMEMMGATMVVSYEPEDSSPVYTVEYVLWTHPSEQVIVSCSVSISSANPQPGLSLEEAGQMFLEKVTAE